MKYDLFNLHPLEPQSIRANVPPSHGAVQSGHALDFLPTAAHLQKAPRGISGNQRRTGCVAGEIIGRTAKEWGVM